MEIRTEILDLLQKDAKMPAQEIAAMLEVTPDQIAKEVAAMKEEGLILGSTTIVNTEKLKNAPAEALVQLKVCPQRNFGYDDIARRVYKFPEVQALYLMSGAYDLAVLVKMETMKAISQFVWEKLAVLEGVSSTETLFIMRKYKDEGKIFVGEDQERRLVVTP